MAIPGDIIEISGTCQETVTITTNDLTLDGLGSAIIDGGGAQPEVALEGVITIDGAQRVTIRGLTIRNGPDGILVHRGAAVTLADLTFQDNADDGILVIDSASLHITNGILNTQANGDDGLTVFNSSALRLSNSTLQADNNGLADPTGDGLVIASASTFNTTGGEPVQITASQNANRGIVVASASAMVLGAQSTTTLTNNGTDGLGIFYVSRFHLPSTSELRLENNAEVGLLVINISAATCANGSTVVYANNGVDFVVDIAQGTTSSNSVRPHHGVATSEEH
ncbi:hypothetical protein C2W62_04320 [Candidatus Entotheonella serta]|nr:hypothetical protein C2W62_04320 [Candidatus Entotheonella serta]